MTVGIEIYGEASNIVRIGAAGGYPILREVVSYWEALREDRLVPLRSEVDPRGLSRALDGAFILERVAPSVARFRLAGMTLTDVAGMEVRGMPVSSLFAPAARPRAARLAEQVFAGPERLEVAMTARHPRTGARIEAAMVLLPLKSDLGDVTRALGCLELAESDTDGMEPMRFDIARAARTDLLTGTTAVDTAGMAPNPAFAEDPAPRPVRQRPSLHVVGQD